MFNSTYFLTLFGLALPCAVLFALAVVHLYERMLEDARHRRALARFKRVDGRLIIHQENGKPTGAFDSFQTLFEHLYDRLPFDQLASIAPMGAARLAA